MGSSQHHAILQQGRVLVHLGSTSVSEAWTVAGLRRPGISIRVEIRPIFYLMNAKCRP
jgi:hypothetical protein